jgi:hypothetical protein
MSDTATLTSNGFVIDFGITGIIIIAYAAVVLILAILAVIALFKQKSLLTQINNNLMRQGMGSAPAAPAYMPPPQPAPSVCPKCGTPFKPDSAFCQTCGAPRQV